MCANWFIGGNKIGDKGVCEFAESLIGNTGLKILSLSIIWKFVWNNIIGYNQIGNNGVLKLAAMLKFNNCLRNLELSKLIIGILMRR